MLRTYPVLLCSILFATARLGCSAPKAPYTFQDTTISVPKGTSNHGDPKLLCIPSRWTDVAKFFAANILAHAATIQNSPGEPLNRGILAMLLALLFPTFGIARGVDAIFCHAITGSSPIQQAKKAGALCEVVRAWDWEPRPGDVIRGAQIEDVRERQTLELATKFGLRTYCKKISIAGSKRRQIFQQCNKMIGLSGRKIHGLCHLPQGYWLSPVSSLSMVADLNSEQDTEGSGELDLPLSNLTANELRPPRASDISSSYSFSKGTIAILQVLYASATLYNTRGDQIDRYGYTAFGLTVAPYLVMSIVNLIGTILTPTYPMAFLVESDLMDEARRRGGFFQGAVGRLALPKPSPQSFDAMFKADNRERMTVSMMNPNSGASGTLETNVGPQAFPSNLAASRFIVLPNIMVPGCNDGLCAEPFWTYRLPLVITSLFIGLVPFSINAGLSRMNTGKSTYLQQAWILFWMLATVLGTVVSSVPSLAILGELLWGIEDYRWLGKRYSTLYVFFMIYCSICAIGVFVIVGQMIVEFGHCVQIYGGI